MMVTKKAHTRTFSILCPNCSLVFRERRNIPDSRASCITPTHHRLQRTLLLPKTGQIVNQSVWIFSCVFLYSVEGPRVHSGLGCKIWIDRELEPHISILAARTIPVAPSRFLSPGTQFSVCVCVQKTGAFKVNKIYLLCEIDKIKCTFKTADLEINYGGLTTVGLCWVALRGLICVQRLMGPCGWHVFKGHDFGI